MMILETKDVESLGKRRRDTSYYYHKEHSSNYSACHHHKFLGISNIPQNS